MMVIVDEFIGKQYMRAVDHEGLEGQGDNSWLVRDMHEELKSWGRPGGARNAIIMKSDGEPAILAVREALAGATGVGWHPSNLPDGSIRRTESPRRAEGP